MVFASESFNPKDLQLVPRPEKPVVLAIGGPIMNLDHEENGIGHCSYVDENDEIQFVQFPLVCLYECRDMGGYQR